MNYLLKSRTRWKRWLGPGLGILCAMLLSATLGAFLAISSAPTPLLKRALTPEEAAIFAPSGSFTGRGLLLPRLSRPVNILVMGMSVLTSDVQNPPKSTENLGYLAQVNSFKGLSDVLLLVRFDPQTEELTILSIPRDTRVVTSTSGVIKINATNVLGGPAVSTLAVSQLLFNLPIDRYVRVNVKGVEKLVDVLGGVTVDIPKDMKYTDEAQHLYIDLKAGRQHLNGEQTLQLLRFRNDEQGDIGRIERQHMVMQALLQQKLNLLTLVRLPQILQVISSHIDSNLDGDELIALSIFAINTDRQKVRTLTLPGEPNSNGRRETSYWIPNENRIQEVVTQYFTQRSEKASFLVNYP
ncbi:MAG: LCP family protein [Coleofasciculus sp. S288]|nr:LCP family protein [Coleofasciculus sp. S288]